MQAMMLHTSGAFKNLYFQELHETQFLTAHTKFSKIDHWCPVFFVSCGVF